jgi:hypothetical protein
MIDPAQRRRRGEELMWRGIVMTMLCGTCTALVPAPAVWALLRGEGAAEPFYVWTSALLGGLPTAIGIGLIVRGVMLQRANR